MFKENFLIFETLSGAPSGSGSLPPAVDGLSSAPGETVGLSDKLNTTSDPLNKEMLQPLTKEEAEKAQNGSVVSLLKEERKSRGMLKKFYTAENAEETKVNKNQTLDVNFRNNNNAEWNIGAGDMLPVNVREVTIKSKDGTTIKGFRAPSSENPTPRRVGYYTAEGTYIPVFTGDKIIVDKVATKEEMDELNKKMKELIGANETYKGASDADGVEEIVHQQYISQMEQDEVAAKEVMEALRAEGYKVPESTGNKQKDFINALTPVAKKTADKYDGKIPWEAMVLQAGLESGWRLNAQTLFGIKGPGFSASTREVFNGKSTTIVDSFRDFGGNTLGERLVNSCVGYCDFITKNGRYQPAINAYKNGGTPANYIEEVAKAGYATDPNYCAVLKKIADQYGVDINRRATA